MRRYNFLSNFDWLLFFIVLAILSIGVFTLSTVGNIMAGAKYTPFYIKQVYWILIGLAGFFVAVTIDYHTFVRYAYTIYWLILLLLLLVAIKGEVGMGAQRWLSLGFVSFQPSELAKIAMVLVFARYFADHGVKEGYRFHQLLAPLLLLVLPVALILKQPDLGTALLILFITTIIVLLVGIRSKSLHFFILLGLLALPFLWHFFWGSLKEYQRMRLMVFFNPTIDPQGSGYHILQSKIAIGSGGLFGKGPFSGTQSQLNFLPEKHTDFVFAVFAEEWGFIGVIILLSLYLFLILRGVDIAYKAKDMMGSIIAAGVVSILTFYPLVNIGMTLGIMPVVGIPLPLMSYGGTSIVTILFSLGLLVNVKSRRLMLFY